MPTKEPESLLTPLRMWRTARGLSIRDLEERTGINRGRLSIYERGVPVPAADMAKIAAVLEGPPRPKNAA